MSNLVSMSDQFQGLPMDSLIGGPLMAACDAQVKLAQSTANFINTVGFEPKRAADGSVSKRADGSIDTNVRYVEFEFERPKLVEKTDDQGNTTTTPLVEDVRLKVPLLSIVPVPNLQVDLVDITFDMEVSSSEEHKDSKDMEVGWDVTIGAKFGPITVDAHITGKIATHQENTRKSDNSAKYHVQVKATNHGMPEGLQRVWDIMAESVAPVTTQTDRSQEFKSLPST